ncbi:hypothetical protein Micbo1qcDRAFT_141367 [Microdochium bolleyi]|uniref:Uncharacterized protein n=1 Tax=Microdochium bolleyi TaxID=196109 RepID=A0A136ILT4_9PEZI|nr:hypothetical protein Micbo1qcDRAFT_141367 [Microdochium bolleyi]
MSSSEVQSVTPGAHNNLFGDSHKRFVIVTTLLSLIDPVRGEPTTHSLDRHPHDDSWKREQLQKKFLDSFALIASTSRTGGETASAVCLEHGRPGGTVLRLASNQGVKASTLKVLQDILNDLTSVASREQTHLGVQHDLMIKIICLARDKILSILERLDRPDTHAQIQQAMSRLDEHDLVSQFPQDFRSWFRKLPSVVLADPSINPEELVNNIETASLARWVYPDQLDALLAPDNGQLPRWLKQIYKLGRYCTAAKSMIKCASKQPMIFDSIHVEAVRHPRQEQFSLPGESRPLLSVLSKITKENPEELRDRLGQFWLTRDPDAKLRQACKMTMTVHAEMQLLSFYDHNPDLTPRLLFMGTSKKACYLCYEFITRHPLAIGVSACHQKLYRGWMPAPCSSTVRKRHKHLLWEFVRYLEETTARDLQTRLGLRRPINSDSTAGPSLTTTAESVTGSLASGVPERLTPSPSEGDRNADYLGTGELVVRVRSPLAES